MTPLLLLTLAAVAGLAHLADLVRDDGYRHSARQHPPRSHHADAFDPGSRPA